MGAGSLRRGALHPAGMAWWVLASVALAPFSVSHAADLRVCVDRASATADRDRAIAGRVASQAELTLDIVDFNSDNGDDAFPLRRFRELLTSKCALVMGFPVDTNGGDVPPGLLATKAYAQTGFALVEQAGMNARTLADLPAGTEVAVTLETAPNLYFAGHPNITSDVHPTEAETMQAIVGGRAKAAMIWQPTVEQYERTPDAVKLAVYPLAEPHARYDVVALYLPQSAHDAQVFNATKIAVTTALPDSGAASPALPALYTKTQAATGFAKFLGNCAMCHGVHLEGRSAPALRGPNWANAKADYTVGEVFTVVSQQMPATDPGNLQKAEYEAIMAYILQQNGYPAGPKPLDFDHAAKSTVELRWHGNSK